MDKAMWDRVAPGFGVVFTVLFVVGFLLIVGDTPALNDPAEEVVAYYDGERGKLLTVTVLFGLSIVAFLWFLGSLVHTLRVEADESRLAATVLAAGGVTASLFGGLVLLNAGLAFQIAEDGDVSVVAALYDLVWVATTLLAYPIAALVFAAGIGLMRGRLLPAWFGWASAVAAAAILVAGTTFDQDGFWAPDGLYNAYVAPTVFLVWVVALSVLLLRRSVGAAEPAGQT